MIKAVATSWVFSWGSDPRWGSDLSWGLLIVDVVVDEGQVLGHLGVDAGAALDTTSSRVPKTHDAHLHKTAAWLAHQWISIIALWIRTTQNKMFLSLVTGWDYWKPPLWREISLRIITNEYYLIYTICQGEYMKNNFRDVRVFFPLKAA